MNATIVPKSNSELKAKALPPYSTTPLPPLNILHGSVHRYNDPLAPVADTDWDAE